MTPLNKPEWYKLCEDEEMKWYFLNLCKAFTRDPELREDLYQQAWAEVGECESGWCKEYYKLIGYRAMNTLYHREYMYHHSDKKERDRLRKRIWRAKQKCHKSSQTA